MSEENKVDLNEVDLNFVRTTRYKVVDKLLTNGQVPNDLESQDMLLKALKDMSKDAISNKRIKSEEKIATGNNANIQLAAAILSQLKVANREELPDYTITPPVLGHELPKPDLVPGETTTDIASENFNTFTGRMGM